MAVNFKITFWKRDTWQKCAALCELTDGCNFWTWDIGNYKISLVPTTVHKTKCLCILGWSDFVPFLIFKIGPIAVQCPSDVFLEVQC